MRSLITLGVVSLVGIAGMIACGDDDSGDGPNTTGGTGGASGGRGGTGGTGGAGGSTGGTGGVAAGGGGAGGAAPLPGPLATCTGCVELIAPLTGPNDNIGDTTSTLPDQIGYQFVFTTPVDFSDGVVTWTIAAVAPNANTFAQLYAQNGAPNYEGIFLSYALDPAVFPANQFREIVLDLAAVAAAPGDAGVPDAGEPPVVVTPDAGADAGGDDAGVPQPVPNVQVGFDKSQISQLGITIGVGATFTGSTVLRVAVDQVDVAGVPGQVSRTFTAGVEGLALNNYQTLPGMQAPVHHP